VVKKPSISIAVLLVVLFEKASEKKIFKDNFKKHIE
jgi:hypothetical protein